MPHQLNLSHFLHWSKHNSHIRLPTPNCPAHHETVPSDPLPKNKQNGHRRHLTPGLNHLLQLISILFFPVFDHHSATNPTRLLHKYGDVVVGKVKGYSCIEISCSQCVACGTRINNSLLAMKLYGAETGAKREVERCRGAWVASLSHSNSSILILSKYSNLYKEGSEQLVY